MFINDQDTFDRWLLTFHPTFYVGIDTEFIRQSTFFPKLVLFQISSANETVVIDTLSVDIAALIEKIRDSSLIKIFFSGRQDLEAVFYEFGILLHPTFDIQIACDFLPYRDNISFQEMVKDICHVAIAKDQQKIDWAARPLSKEAIDYAYDDSFYLIPMFKVLKRKLKAVERYSWVLEESARVLDQVIDQGQSYFEKKIFNPMSPKSSLQQEMVLWREQYARCQNVPRKRVYGDALIHEIKDLFWEPVISKDFEYRLHYSQMSCFRKKSKEMFRLAKQYNIPKKYFDSPFDVIKLCFHPLESNIFLEGWRYQLLQQS